MDQRAIDLYDEYTHVGMDRRLFLERLTAIAGGMAAALALLPLLEADRAHAAIVPPADPRLDATRLAYAGESGAIQAYAAFAKGSGKLPAVIVIHENRGLNPHIEDVARRLALGGFLALAPDCLSPLGGTPADEDAARDSIRKLDAAQTVGNLAAAIAFLAKHARGNGKVGAVGFCWGGGMVGELAVRAANLGAGVVYYGRQPDTTQVEKIQAPLLLHYAGLDERINAGIPAFEAALKEHQKQYTLYVYDGVNHAFNNDTSAARYDEKAAALAWSRTIAFLHEHLRA